jgi:hypothetical protein
MKLLTVFAVTDMKVREVIHASQLIFAYQGVMLIESYRHMKFYQSTTMELARVFKSD